MGVKYLIRSMLVGGAIGVILVTWLGPGYLVWYFKPPVSNALSCEIPIEWALTRLRNAQIIALALGSFAGVLVLFGYQRRKKEKHQRT